MTTTTARVVAHILLFLVAIIVFYWGLGTGLSVSPRLGTGLWIVAGAIAAFNLIWMLRWLQRRNTLEDRNPQTDS